METLEKLITPDYENMHWWESYADALGVEYRQCIEEGLDVSAYEALMNCVREMKKDENREAMADVLFKIISNSKIADGYPYVEPSDLDGIRVERQGGIAASAPDGDLRDRVAGAWYGRICGCLLGKTVEGIRTEELDVLLRSSGNYPMHRYILSTDVTQKMLDTFKFDLSRRCYADKIENAPADDDTNYTVLYQYVIENFGRDFTPADVSRTWTSKQPKNAYCTAERVAFCNFVKGFAPPYSASYKNAFREWIGAQIRGDYFGYVNPGDPETAADMAWRDACVSHVKNGIYGEMFAAAMIAAAATENDIEKIISAGIAQIPQKSRLHAAIEHIIQMYKDGVSADSAFSDIHSRWDEHKAHDWCHTISNAEIVAACLLFGGGEFGKSICMAVQTGFDTDCNGATVGSVLGMRNGVGSIGKEWTAPLGGKLDTAIFGVGTVDIGSLIDKTMKHISEKTS